MLLTRPLVILLLFVLSNFGGAGLTVADEPKADDTNKPKLAVNTEFQQRIDRSLERYKVFENDDKESMKTVYPVLAWTNPGNDPTRKARTVLFVKDGQPKCVCCMWPSGKNLFHEFGALTREALRGELDEGSKWAFEKDSIKFKPIPNADAPASDRRRRLVQMRQLSRRFGAIEMENRKRKPDRIQLRMLTTPLYRYEKESKTIIDGTLFCFADGTDPEAVLVIEAVKDGDAMRWEYAFMRRTTLSVTGQLDDTTVWSTTEVGWTGFNQIGYQP